MYHYDDRGFRIAKVAFAGTDVKTTWYVRDASGNITSVFEQAGEPDINNLEAVAAVEVSVYGAGKLGTYYPAQDGSVSYELTDHLGNVRALLRDDIKVFRAAIEDNNVADETNPRVQEMAYFQNLFETEVDDINMNHTPDDATIVQNPSKAAYLFWQDGVAGIEASDMAIGPAIALSVNPGDTIKAEAFVRYENKLSYSRNGITLGVLSSLLGNSFATTLAFDGSTLAQTTQLFDDALTLGSFLADGADETRPFAYISYIVFDEDMVSVASDRVRVTEDAGFDPPEAGLENQHEHLKFADEIVIGPDGKYIYLWVSNESEDTKVWFDDFTVTHSSIFVAQASDYGVWGDVIREQKSDLLERYRFGYQGQFAEKDEETGWNHFALREYDPVIGRWTVVDPMGQYWSPYIGMGNDPTNLVDPTGGCVDPVTGAKIPCPGGIPEAGNENLRVLNEVTVKGSWNMWDQLNYFLQNEGGGLVFYSEQGGGTLYYTRNGKMYGAIFDPADAMIDFGEIGAFKKFPKGYIRPKENWASKTSKKLDDLEFGNDFLEKTGLGDEFREFMARENNRSHHGLSRSQAYQHMVDQADSIEKIHINFSNSIGGGRKQAPDSSSIRITSWGKNGRILRSDTIRRDK